MINFMAGVIVGGLIGAWFYRWTLKRDPAKLERWAAEAKIFGEKIEDRFKK